MIPFIQSLINVDSGFNEVQIHRCQVKIVVTKQKASKWPQGLPKKDPDIHYSWSNARRSGQRSSFSRLFYLILFRSFHLQLIKAVIGYMLWPSRGKDFLEKICVATSVIYYKNEACHFVLILRILYLGVYGVGKAAENPPALVVLSHTPMSATRTVAWVGKGIVYDTGGLCIKTKVHWLVTCKQSWSTWLLFYSYCCRVSEKLFLNFSVKIW